MSASIAGGSPAATNAATTRPRFNADFDGFLKLLTAQLRNQDPTRSMDAQQMTQQLVQFAGVEQQLAANANLERLIGLQQGQQLLSAAPLMGRVVEVESDRLTLQGGEARLRLPAAGDARTARIEVLDAQGRVMRSATAKLGPEASDWRWDGRDASGRARPDGAYAVRVTGLAADGAAAPVTATVFGRVTGAERRGGEVRLQLGGLSVEFGRMRGMGS